MNMPANPTPTPTPDTPTTLSNPSGQRLQVGMRLPPPVLLGLLVKVAVLLQFAVFGGLHFSLAGGMAGAALALAAVALLATCTGLFRKAGTPVRPTSPTTTIVTTGPYRLSRNPMYLGLAGLTIGVGVATGSVCLVAAAGAFVVLVTVMAVLPEERYLERQHGDAYRAYCRQVRRWV